MQVLANSLILCIVFSVLVAKHTRETTTLGQDVKSNHADQYVYGFLAKKSLHYSYTSKTKQGGILDYHQNLSIYFNGQTGEAFGISYEDGRGVYIPAGVTNKTFNVNYHDENYFKGPISVKELFQIGERLGYKFEADSITNEISEKLAGIIESMSSDYSNKCEALAIAIEVSRISSNNLKTSLGGMDYVMGESLLAPRGDYNWLYGIYKGMSDFFVMFDGGLNALKEKNIKLDMNTLLTQETGFHVLIYFLENLHTDFDLKVLQKMLNSQLEFFKLINKLGGELTHGFDGFIYVITGIVSYNSKHSSKDNLMDMLRTYFNSPLDDNTLRQKWYTSINDLLETLKKLRLEQDFIGLVKLLQDILNNCWFDGNINMSAVIEIIICGNEDGVTWIMEALK